MDDKKRTLQATGIVARDPRDPEKVLADPLAVGAWPEEVLATLEPSARAYLNYLWSQVVEAKEYFQQQQQALNHNFQAELSAFEKAQAELLEKTSALEEALSALQESSELELAPLRQSLKSLQDKAAEACARIGVVADLESPNPAVAYELAAAAPLTGNDIVDPALNRRSLRSKMFMHLLNTIMGLITGVSVYAIVGGRFGPAILQLDGLRLLMSLISGVALLLVAGHWGVYYLWRIAAEKYYQRHQVLKVKLADAVIAIAVATVFSLAIVGIEATVAHEGALAESRRRNEVSLEQQRFQGEVLTEHQSQPVYWALALLVVVPFVLGKATTGWSKGRNNVSSTLLAERHAERVQEAHDNPQRQAASQALLEVLTMKTFFVDREGNYTKRKEQLEAELGQRKSDLEALTATFELEEEELRAALQRDYDSVIALKQTFDQTLRQALDLQHNTKRLPWFLRFWSNLKSFFFRHRRRRLA
jgi:hypothetical protein